MKLLFTLIFLFTTLAGSNLAQNFNSQQLYDSYRNYRTKGFENKRFKHSALKKQIESLKKITL